MVICDRHIDWIELSVSEFPDDMKDAWTEKYYFDVTFIGIVNLNSLHFPSSLFAQILPPCFSTNSLQRINPSPVPISLFVPRVE